MNTRIKLTQEAYDAVKTAFGPCTSLYEGDESFAEFIEAYDSLGWKVPTTRVFIKRELAHEDICLDRGLGYIEDPTEHTRACREGEAFIAAIKARLAAAGLGSY